MRRPAPDPVGPGQESVWEYPRPPRLEPTAEHVQVTFGGRIVVDTRRAVRVLETSHPPAYYLPFEDALDGLLRPAAGRSFCEWKGWADYFDLVAGGVEVPSAAWAYPTPTRGFEALIGRFSLYPGRVDRATVDGEQVRAQDGGFYGGWITSRVVGPFKGAPGTGGW